MEPPRRRRGGLGTSSSPTQPMTNLRPGPHLTGPEPDHSYLGSQPPGQARHSLARPCPVYRPDGPTARTPACHARVRFQQTHPCKLTPSPAPLPRRTGRLGHRHPKIPLRAAPVNGDPPGGREAAHTPFRSKAWSRTTH